MAEQVWRYSCAMQSIPDVKCRDAAPSGSDGGVGATLRAAAFGGLPEGTGSALPSAQSGRELWWRAVAHGGLGYYARAAADLDRLRRVGRAGPCSQVLLSLESSTRASLLRQMGNHAVAAEFDGRALALAARGEPAMVQPRADALTGLAADALGRADHRVARRLLEMCAAELAEGLSGDGAPGDGLDPLWRGRLRLLWVRAETAMAAGDGDSALALAQAAAELAATIPSERHRVKTQLIGAAAAAVSGNLGLSAERAEAVVERAGRAGLLPLRWAACMLLQGVRPSGGVAAERTRCEMELGRRGGHPA